MAFQDKTIVCKECGMSSSSPQVSRNSMRKRVLKTNQAAVKLAVMHVRRMNEGGFRRQNRQLYDAVCADCGAATQVPFKPRNDRPVYCSECYQNHRMAQNGF